MDNTTDIETTADEILAAELSESAAYTFAKFMAKVAYTTTGLFAMECWLREQGDEEGANKIGEFCREFAKHEAATL